jgi:hypothetical protein
VGLLAQTTDNKELLESTLHLAPLHLLAVVLVAETKEQKAAVLEDQAVVV